MKSMNLNQNNTSGKLNRSRISKFYRRSIEDRLRILNEKQIISTKDYITLLEERQLLSREEADKMIENVIGVFGLPMGLGLNFIINDKAYVVPMVVEEPSILAAVSSAAKVVREAGGFSSELNESLLIGQVQLVDIADPEGVQRTILQQKQQILDLANSLHPNMVARGGGAKDLEVKIHPQSGTPGNMVVVHLHVDTRDAMGANLVNSMCEGVAPLIEKITKGKVYLRILSNLTDRSVVRARCEIPVELLAFNDASGEEVRDGIIRAAEFAAVDSYRASTHNKGIMNGIDPVAIATGNDWRAVEAAAHAFAARNGKYTSLTNWYRNDRGDLTGTIEVPLKAGTVGGSLKSNSAVGLAQRILGVQSARELAQVMGAVGLAQNFSALRALGTEGIQRGHMALHARSVVSTAGAPPKLFDKVQKRLLESGEIKVWKAREVIEELLSSEQHRADNHVENGEAEEELSGGYGKIILTGEHSVVYGKHAVAAPINLKVKAKVSDRADGVHVSIPIWGVEQQLGYGEDHSHSIYRSLEMILDELGLQNRGMNIEIVPEVPRAMGMGASAALAVAIIRALSVHFDLKLSNQEVNDLAFKSEDIVHGGASGIDNTVSVYGQLLVYRKGDPPLRERLKLQRDIPIVIGLSNTESMTAGMVSRVREAYNRFPELYEEVFSQMDELAVASMKAIEEYDLSRLGEIMNLNHGYLNALQVSCPQVEELVQIARNSGALGAKLTGGGGGGAIIALCNSAEMRQKVKEDIRKKGYDALVTEIKATVD